MHPTASAAGLPAHVTSSFFHSPDDFTPPERNEIGRSHNSFALIESDHTRSKFRFFPNLFLILRFRISMIIELSLSAHES